MYEVGQKVVYHLSLTGVENAFKLGRIRWKLSESRYQLDNNDTIHESQIVDIIKSSQPAYEFQL